MPAPSLQQRLTPAILDALRQQADPPADQVIDQLIQSSGRESARQLFDLLIRRIDLPLTELPEVIQDFIHDHRQFPPWTDPQQIKLAEKLFLDHGPKFLVFLYYKSLPLLYTNKNGAQVLVHTGRLAHQEDQYRQFSRRVSETGQFLIDVMCPGGLHPGGIGIEATLKVRLIHAAIRAFIPKQHWDSATLGVPINQEDLAMTLMSFSIALLEGLETIGITETEERKAAYIHAWNVVGHLMGIDEKLLPSNPGAASWLLSTIMDRQAGPSESGKLLTKALLRFADDHLRSDLLEDAPESLMRFLIGSEKAAMLGIEPATGCWGIVLPAFLQKVLGWVEKKEDQSALVNLINERVSLHLIKRMIQYFNPHKEKQFHIPEVLQRAWGIGDW